MAARRQRGCLELRAGQWSIRFWQTRTTPDGAVRARVRVALGAVSRLKTQGAARLAADRLLAEQGMGSSGRVVTFEDYADLFERDHLPVLQLTTQRAYRSHLKCHLRPLLKRTNLHEIQSSVPQVLIARMLAAKLSRPTIAATITLLGNMLQKAAAEGYATAQINRKAYKLPPRGVPRPRRCLTPAQAERIIAAAEFPFRALYAVLAYQGLRCSEALALEWRHVDLAGGVLSIRQATTLGHLKITKSTNSATDVPMAPELVEILQAFHVHLVGYRRDTSGLGATGLLFPTEAGTPRRAGDVRMRHFAPLLRRLDIPHAGLHAFRHGLATNLFAAGVSAPVVRSMMRHGDIKTTLGYTHVESEDLRRAAASIGALAVQSRGSEAQKLDPSGPTSSAGPSGITGESP